MSKSRIATLIVIIFILIIIIIYIIIRILTSSLFDTENKIGIPNFDKSNFVLANEVEKVSLYAKGTGDPSSYYQDYFDSIRVFLKSNLNNDMKISELKLIKESKYLAKNNSSEKQDDNSYVVFTLGEKMWNTDCAVLYFEGKMQKLEVTSSDWIPPPSDAYMCKGFNAPENLAEILQYL
ncbi:hypothetical protein IPJ91_01185 [bacterium]|nr:MAG: hypothetical protein IPJ91_01185 [bacterium]